MSTPSPFINSVTPSSGPTAGGTSVLITGQNFVFGCKVKFGETEVPTTFITSNQVRATTPPRPAPGVVNVVLTNSGGQTAVAGQLFLYAAAPPPPPPLPIVVQVTAPGAGQTFDGGQSLNVQWTTTGQVTSHLVQLSLGGGSFNTVTPGELPGTARNFSFILPVPPTQNTPAVVRVVARNGGVQVAGGDSGVFNVRRFITLPPGGGLQLSPENGPPESDVTLTGNFSAVLGVNFGNFPSPEFIVEGVLQNLTTTPAIANSVTAEVPAGALSGFVTVLTPNGSLTSATRFNVTPLNQQGRPMLDADLCANPGDRGVRITGTNFVPVQTKVIFPRQGGGVVRGQNVTVESATVLRCDIPSNAVAGNYKVKVTGKPKSNSRLFSIPPSAFDLAAVSPQEITTGRTVRLVLSGTNLTLNKGDYKLLRKNPTTGVPDESMPLAGVEVLFVAPRPTYRQLGLPEPGQSFFLDAPALLLSRENEPPVVELLLKVDKAVPRGTYSLMAKAGACPLKDFVDLRVGDENTPRPGLFPKVTTPALNTALAALNVPLNFPDPSFAALLATGSAERSRFINRIVLALQPVLNASAPAPSITPNASGAGEIGVRSVRKAKRVSTTPLVYPLFDDAPFLSNTPTGDDRDCLPEVFEWNLAKAFLPVYVVSGKEKFGTGFGKFAPNEPVRLTPTINAVLDPVNPVVYFRVKPLGVSQTGGRRFAVAQIDYFTLWTRDDGLPGTPDLIENLLTKILTSEEKSGHINEEERSAVLVAAELSPTASNAYPLNVGAYQAYEVYVTAHEDTFIDQTTYLSVPSGNRRAGNHVRLFLAQGKHGTYEGNPGGLILSPLGATVSFAALVAAIGAASGGDDKITELAGAAFAALLVVGFVGFFVERMESPIFDRRVSDNNLLNVGEPDPGRQLNGATWIRETRGQPQPPGTPEPRDLLGKFTKTLWEVQSPVSTTVEQLVFEPAAGPLFTEVSIFGQNLQGTSAVSFNGADATFTQVTPQLLRVTVPLGARTGRIRINTCAGAVIESAADFNVCATAAPKLFRFFTPENAAGAQVELVGENLSGVNSVQFGGRPAPFVLNSPTSITTYAPRLTGAGQNVEITVRAGNNQATLPSFPVPADNGKPSLRGFHPPFAPGGSVISLFGANFDEGNLKVEFGTDPNPVPGVIVNEAPGDRTSSLVKVRVPDNAKNGRIKVTNGNGQLDESDGDFILVNPNGNDAVPAVERITPTCGPATQTGGFDIDIYGVNLERVSGVRIGDTTTTFNLIKGPSDARAFQLRARVPSNPGGSNDSLFVTLLTGGAPPVNSARAFIRTDNFGAADFIPNITSVTPQGSDAVKITGTNLSGATVVRVNGVEVCFTFDAASSSIIATGTASVGTTFVVYTPGGIARFTRATDIKGMKKKD